MSEDLDRAISTLRSSRADAKRIIVGGNDYLQVVREGRDERIYPSYAHDSRMHLFCNLLERTTTDRETPEAAVARCEDIVKRAFHVGQINGWLVPILRDMDPSK